MYGRVYKITNLVNNKSYIGVTTKSLSERFFAHCNRAVRTRSAIQKAIAKYGKNSFIIVEIDTAETSEELFAKETYWIQKEDTLINGYNLTTGGGGITNMTQEIKDKISKTKTGVSNPKLLGREITTEHRLKISKTLDGKKVRMFNPETGHEITLDWVKQAEVYGFNPSNVVSVCKGKRKHTKGYLCEYITHGNPDLITENKDSVAVQRIASEPLNGNII